MNAPIDTENDNDESIQENEDLEEEGNSTEKLKETLGGKDIIQLKNNFIPRGLIPLENIFDQNDVAKNPKVKPVDDAIEDKNIGTEEKPNIIKLSKSL